MHSQDFDDTELQEVYTMRTYDLLNLYGKRRSDQNSPARAVAWNKWMMENPDEHIELNEADFRGANLYKANLSEADLRGANLRMASLNWANLYKANLYKANLNWANLYRANLYKANLSEADLRGAYPGGADLSGADLSKANLSWANLSKANLSWANLSGADLSRAYLYKANLSETNLSRAVLIETNMESAILTGCIVYKICAWELELEGAMQNDLVITPPDQPAITVDNLEVAQFIYLLLHNEKIRNVIDTMTSKVVLILGRFTPERKTVLDALRTELRQRGYLPILFDFEKSTTKDFTNHQDSCGYEPLCDCRHQQAQIKSSRIAGLNT